MITPRKYAENHQAAYSTVMSWLQRDLIPGAEKHELPTGGWVYTIPENAPKPDLKPGPVPKTETKPSAKKRASKKGKGQK